ncbi:MAG: hypothetical protein JWR27_1154 [Aeromicrobium sp.]|jgi:hypothetical protein|nr:hypothetical protein [Aeromicrobium sp.]
MDDPRGAVGRMGAREGVKSSGPTPGLDVFGPGTP